jgi:hypothetical protein
MIGLMTLVGWVGATVVIVWLFNRFHQRSDDEDFLPRPDDDEDEKQ